MCTCGRCAKTCGVLMLALGISFLLKDLGYWNFWNVSWWTALFLLAGIGALASTNCPECQTASKGKKK